MSDLDRLDIIGNDTYAEHGYPHEAWARLRREDPVHWTTHQIDVPFWAVTKHADLIWISKQPARFVNGPRLAAFPEVAPPEGESPLRHLLNMDPPEHARYRRLASPRFTPRGLGRMRREIETITREVLDQMMGDGGEREGDFVQLLSAPLPLQVLAELLGAPRELWPDLFDWTNRVIGSSDPEYQEKGEGALETIMRARLQLFECFSQMARERRQQPRDDIVSALANAELDGAPLPDRELLSFYFLLVVAGNETTRNALTGGLLAFAENPDQWKRLREDPGLLDTAVEEIVRWTSPVIQFCRTATEDVELRGKKVRRGEHLCLFYPSANRDEEVFDEPFRFRIDRKPNRHVAFGIGEHFCLGANLARLELRAVFRHLAERLVEFDVVGPVERLRSSFVGGIKRMPIRYRLEPGTGGSRG